MLGKDLSLDITLKELYDYSNINFFIYTTDLKNFSKIEISHKTHPNIKVITAIYMSCCIPIIFKPAYYNNNYYLDGGINANVPINECLINEKCNNYEILICNNNNKYPIDCCNNYYIINNYSFINNNNTNNSNNSDDSDYDNNENNINFNSLNLFTYLIHIIKILFNKILKNKNSNINQFVMNIALSSEPIDLKYWYFVLRNSSERSYLINLANICVNNFIKDYSNNIILDNSNIILDNSNNFIKDNSNIILDNSNNFIKDYSNIILDNSNIILDCSNNFIKDYSNNIIL